MAKPSPPTLKPKTITSFLICFRYSKSKNLRSHDEEDDDEDNNKLKIRKKTSSSSSSSSSSWLCWSGFRLKKAAATKTVPLDISTVSPDQPNNLYKSSSAKLVEPEPDETKSKHVKFQVPAVTDIVEDPGVPIQRRLIVSGDKTPANSKRKPPETVSDTINLENRTRQLGSDNACLKRRLSFCRKVDSIRTAGGANGSSSQPGSPVQQPRTVAAVPPPKRTRRGGGETVGAFSSSSLARKTWLVSNERNMMMMRSKRLDPLVGMTVIMVTLIIMVLWGRLCAILCTAAWLYLLPRLTHQNGNLTTTAIATTSSSTAGNIFPHPRDDYYLDLMMSSDEYKKKVVLEGFLERNNHRTG